MSAPVPDDDSEPLFDSEEERLEFAAACEAWRRRKDEAPDTDPSPAPITDEEPT